jgi:chromatin segregation and condensation protein Rec8/ScpA/Scc1 (kleisin family)
MPDGGVSIEGEGMAAQQLELDFESAIALARQDPFQIELRELLAQFEPSLEGLEREVKLRLAGDGLMAMAEVLQQKAEAMYQDWCDRHNDEGPIPDEDFLVGLVQETMFLDISGVVRSPKGRRKVEAEEDIDSTVTEMDKEELLLLLEAAEVEVDPEPLMSIEKLEYDESVSDWILVIRAWLNSIELEQADLLEIIRGTAMSPARVWMALLLGGFKLENQGDFYQGRVLVG